MIRLSLPRFLRASELIKVDGHRQHVFKWGVGNKFRSFNRNRFSPVHHARPKEVTIPDDYFTSPVPGQVEWDSLNEAWEVFWFEGGKFHAKPFPVKKFGVDQSKQEAGRFLDELKTTGRFRVPEERGTGDGVFWDERMQCWFSLSDGRVRGYGAVKHGFEQSKKRATEKDAKSDVAKLREKIRLAIRQ
jgi:hypothetical protein